MMSSMEEIYITKPDSGTPWGFRLQGGADYRQRLSIQKVTPESLAATANLLVGDCVVGIGRESTEELTHQQALDKIRLCGTQLHLSVLRQGHPSSDIVKTTPYSNTSKFQEESSARSNIAFQNLNAHSGTPSIAPPAYTPRSAQSTPVTNNIHNPPTNGNMAWNGSNQQDIPDQLLSQFNKKTDEKPFSYLPSGGMAELQQRQKAAPPPTRPKPSRQTSNPGPVRQSSHAGVPQRQLSSSSTGSATYDPDSLFTPAYKQHVQQHSQTVLPAEHTGNGRTQQEQWYKQHVAPPVEVGIGPGKCRPEEVAAYILQPDGTMAALRINNRPSPDLQNSAVMAALKEEQQAQMVGKTTGKIQSASGSKQGLSFRVLQWLTGTDSEDGSETASNVSYPGSHGISNDYHQNIPNPARATTRQKPFHSSSEICNMTDYQADKNMDPSPEVSNYDLNANNIGLLYSGSSFPSRSFRRLLRSLSTDEKSVSTVSEESYDNEQPKKHALKIIQSARQDGTTPQTMPTAKVDVAYSDF